MSDDNNTVTEFQTRLNQLPEESTKAAREARRERKAFSASPASAFVRSMQECMAAYLKARSQGVEREDAIRGIEHVLRETWLKQTTKYPPCESCDGTGWEKLVCRPYVRCERESCQAKDDEWQHTYAVPCSCPKGDRFREKVVTVEDEFASVGKSKRGKSHRGFSKIGE